MTSEEARGFRGLLEVERERISGAIANLHENGRRVLDDETGDGGLLGNWVAGDDFLDQTNVDERHAFLPCADAL